MKLKTLIFPIVIVLYMIFSKYVSEEIMGNLFFLVLGYFIGDNFDLDLYYSRSKAIKKNKDLARKKNEERVELIKEEIIEEPVSEVVEEDLVCSMDDSEEIVILEEEMVESMFCDELSERIIKTFWNNQSNVSASQIQRKYRIGYNRAARIIDEFEELGLITPLDGYRRSIIEEKYIELGLNDILESDYEKNNDLIQ